MAAIDKYLKLMVEKQGSDLHLHSDFPMTIRISGSLEKFGNPISRKQLVSILGEILTSSQKKQLNDGLEVDFAYSLEGVARFRGNIFLQDKKFGGVFRAIPETILNYFEIGAPPILQKIAREERGLILVTGPTGSGKSTTIAAMIDQINTERNCRIMTLEDPVEFVHKDKKAMISHKEVGVDISSFHQGLQASFREDLDVVLLGEIRDRQSMQSALNLAESGVLVLATLHTMDVANTVKRVASFYDEDQQEMVRNRFAKVVRSIISMRLIPALEGGRVASFEIMISNSGIKNQIEEGKDHQIISSMEQGKLDGMCSFEMSIKELLLKRKIDQNVASAYLKAKRD